MNKQLRNLFDRLLEQVLDELPDEVLAVFDEVPLIVEDHPGKSDLRDTGMEEDDSLLGLHDGFALTELSVEHSGTLPSRILIYREPLIDATRDAAGEVDEEALLDEIRITVLHEVGHHFGFDEDDLDERGLG